jgi:alkylglycerol monooxygenase
VATRYGFWTHTELVAKLWWPLEKVFVTPSHHRAHHGVNPQYIDPNYANLLIIRDRLFATFVAEPAPVRCALIRNIKTCNRLMIQRKPNDGWVQEAAVSPTVK